MTTPALDLTDIAELGDLLGFLRDWLGNDRDQLAASLNRFVGHPSYNLDTLRHDLARFTFLLGTDTEHYIPEPL